MIRQLRKEGHELQLLLGRAREMRSQGLSAGLETRKFDGPQLEEKPLQVFQFEIEVRVSVR